MKRLVLLTIVLGLAACSKPKEAAKPPADAGTAKADVAAPAEEPKPEGPSVDVAAIAVAGDWDKLKSQKLERLSTRHERWVCAMGYGEQLVPNPENFAAGRAKENRSAELVACGKPVLEGTEKSNMVAGAKFMLAPDPKTTAQEAIKFDKTNDWRLTPIALSIKEAGKGLTFKMVARMVGRRVSVPNSCNDLRPSPMPDTYVEAARAIRILAAAHDKKHKPKILGDERATVDSLHSYRVADRMQLSAAFRHYLAGDVTKFKEATKDQPSITDNFRTCMAQWAWELGENEQAKEWAEWVVKEGYARDVAHAEAILAYIALDEGRKRDTLVHADRAFQFRAKASKNANLVSLALIIPTGMGLFHQDAKYARETADKVVRKEELPLGPLIISSLSENPPKITPENIATLKWQTPERGWALPAAMLTVASMTAPEQREAVLDKLEPHNNLLAYYKSRELVAKWYKDEAAQKEWAERAARLRTQLKDLQPALNYSW